MESGALGMSVVSAVLANLIAKDQDIQTLQTIAALLVSVSNNISIILTQRFRELAAGNLIAPGTADEGLILTEE